MPTERPPIRFGIFEVDLAAGEIRRNGIRVRLQEQPFQVLAALLERPGEIVSKEQLQERIWKGDTFVDYEGSLATAVNKLRQALGDSATRPRFIETVPKRGYRFIAHAADSGGAAPAPEPGLARSSPDWKTVAVLVALAATAAWFVASRESEPSVVEWSAPQRTTTDDGLTFQPTISRDGSLIAYSSDRAGEGNLDIWVKQIGGGEPLRITDDPADDTAPHFSPDGKLLAFRSERGEGGAYVASSLGGSVRFVAAHGHRPRFSPDGKWIAYFTGRREAASLLFPVEAGEVYVVPSMGGTPRRIAADAAYEMYPVWSPSGAEVLLATAKTPYVRASYEWRVVTLDGVDRGPTGAVAAIENSPAARLFTHYYPDHWDSDGFVGFSSGDADSNDLWRIQVGVDSAHVLGEPERVLPGPGFFHGASKSKGGRLVFASLTVNPDIWSLAIDADRGVATAEAAVRLTSTAGSDAMPVVSLDGSQVAFQSNRSGKFEIWLLDIASGHQRQLIAVDGRPVLNTAGSRLLVGGREGMWILALDGIVQKQFQGARYTSHWSPDERLVLFDGPQGSERAIFLLDVDSGEATTLLPDVGESSYQGRFSPDGRWLAWRTTDGIWIAPFRKSTPIPEAERVKISEADWFVDKPRWSPNGNLLYHTSDRDGFVCIYAQPLDLKTQSPRGDLLDIYHSHQAKLSIGNVGMPDLELSVARDKIVFGMAEVTGNIWMIESVEQD